MTWLDAIVWMLAFGFAWIACGGGLVWFLFWIVRDIRPATPDEIPEAWRDVGGEG